MGYYVNISASNIKIKAENKQAAYDAVCAINDPKYNHLKNGGSHGPDGRTYWYSWMPENYPEQTETLEDVLELLGFELGYDMDGSIIELGYDNKTGNEDVFFLAMAPYVEAGSYIMWRGEDGATWAWEFLHDTMYLRSVQMTLAGDYTRPTYLHVNEDFEVGNKGRYEHREVVL